MGLRVFAAFAVSVGLLAGCGGSDQKNRDPVLGTTSLSATEDTTLVAQLSATDADGDPLTFTVGTTAQHGQLTVSSAGALNYVPAANYAGSDSFIVQVQDNAGGSASGTVTINVAAVNDAPVLTTSTLNAVEDTPLAATAQATDVENNTITFALATNALHGQATVAANGAISYTPAADYAGADSFSVKVTDDGGASSTGTINVSVASVNDAPVLTTTTLNAVEDVPLPAAVQATDADNNPLNFTLVTDAQHGHVTVSAGGVVEYVPNVNFNGPDSFVVKVSDGQGGETSGTVTINVAAVNDAPVLTSTQFSLNEDSTLVTQLTATDIENDAITFSLASGPAHGQATVSASGQLSFTPASNYNGADQISVKVADAGASSSATVALTVTPVNDPPVASDDELRLPAGASVDIPLLSNDHDVDGDTLQVSILSQPGGGTVSVSGTNTVTFVPDHAFNGPIRFNYRVTDTAGATSDATVRAVIGEFKGLYFLSDETTPGLAELHFFDGLHLSRISGDLPAGSSIPSFSVAGDGSSVAYVVESADHDRIYVTSAQAPAARLVYTGGTKVTSSGGHTGVTMNRNGTYARVYDLYSGLAVPIIVDTAAGSGIPAGDATTTQMLYFVFSPTDDNYYAQVQVGGSPPPMSGTGYLTLYRGVSTSPNLVSQVGSVYAAPSQGGGSGMEPQVTADGRYVVHQELVYSPSPIKSSVLVYDSVANVEAPMYRRPVSGEIGMWDGFALSNDGHRVCFQFREPGGGSFGPSKYIVGDPAAPASAVPVTPVTTGGYKCFFGSDNRTLFYIAQTSAAPTMQMWSVDSGSPGTPALVNRPFTGSESLEDYWVARDAMRVVIGTRGISSQIDYYSVALDDPSNYIIFATNIFDDNSLPGQIDGKGVLLAYAMRPAPLSGLRRLTLLSTQSSTYSLSLTRADTSTGLLQFAWAP